MKDGIQGLGHCSPTFAAEEELVKWVEVDILMRLTIRPTIYPTNESLDEFPRTDLRGRRRRRCSSKKDQSYDPSTGIHTSRSSNPAALRRPEKNATEKTRGRKPLTDSNLEQRLNHGLKVEQQGLEGGRVAQGPWGLSVLCPPPLPLLYRWPGGPLAEIRGVGVPLGLLLPKGVLK